MDERDLRIRDLIARLVPPWLAERIQAKKTVGYRVLWAIVAPLDAIVDTVNQGIAAWFPGVGTPTAMPFIGRSRGLIRNQNETIEDYAARLKRWLDIWPDAASQLIIAMAIHAFLHTHPRVRVINRQGIWITVQPDGSVERLEGDAWDWDSVSHPERSNPDEPWWSDEWIIVQASQWAERPGTLGELVGDDGYALGHLATHQEVDAIKGLINQWKGAHSCVRAVLFTTDPNLFDPDVPSSLPDGTWGAWSINVGGSQVPSGRDLSSTRYWEPR